MGKKEVDLNLVEGKDAEKSSFSYRNEFYSPSQRRPVHTLRVGPRPKRVPINVQPHLKSYHVGSLMVSLG